MKKPIKQFEIDLPLFRQLMATSVDDMKVEQLEIVKKLSYTGQKVGDGKVYYVTNAMGRQDLIKREDELHWLIRLKAELERRLRPTYIYFEDGDVKKTARRVLAYRAMGMTTFDPAAVVEEKGTTRSNSTLEAIQAASREDSDGVLYKPCNTCKDEKPYASFWKCSRAATGRAYVCIDCHNAWKKDRKDG